MPETRIVEVSTRGLQGLPGRPGKDGRDGSDGRDGADGTNGTPGLAGLSAYQVWLAAGHVGSEQDYLASLRSPGTLLADHNLSDLSDPTAALATLNGLDRRILSLATDPALAHIAVGTIRVAKNTTTGRLSLWANDGGTIVDLLALTIV